MSQSANNSPSFTICFYGVTDQTKQVECMACGHRTNVRWGVDWHFYRYGHMVYAAIDLEGAPE